jgi:inorganic pyrophosphatase
MVFQASPGPPEIEVVIEVPRGSFLKRGSTGHVDFISPLPCPFNYGSVPIS